MDLQPEKECEFIVAELEICEAFALRFQFIQSSIDSLKNV